MARTGEPMIEERPTTFTEFADGDRTVLVGSLADVDLIEADYIQSEWLVEGTADAYGPVGELGLDGCWNLEVVDRETFATRIVVRKPVDASSFSGTVVVEWLNVSSGADACPVFGFAGPEITRAGHAWVGVSAQWAGVVSSPALVDVAGMSLRPLCDVDPVRYRDLHHPGDAFSFDIFRRVGAALADTAVSSGPLAGWQPSHLVAVGESQSADALVTYIDGIHPLAGVFDGFLVISREGAPMPLGCRGCGVDFTLDRPECGVAIRDDLDVPVLTVQTETDVLGPLHSHPSRQADTETFRLWEVAGTAHVDRSVVGEFEGFLGCADPVNRGQLRFVVRAALAHLIRWATGGSPPGSVERLAVREDPKAEPPELRYAIDSMGNVSGGVRTPCVDAAVEVLSGINAPEASHVCQLFGRTLAVPDDVLHARYPSQAAYLDAYATALDEAITRGFILDADRLEVLADARPNLIDW